MPKPAAYLLLGAVHEISDQAPPLDDALQHKLIQRRLKRLERVLTSHGGWLVRPIEKGLIACFHSAEAALIGASEMQRRCAVIPKLAETQLALRIAIHTAENLAWPGNAADPALGGLASLAGLVPHSGIVVSETFTSHLPAELQAMLTPTPWPGRDATAYVADWNCMPMQRTPATPSPAPGQGPQLILRQGKRSYCFDSRLGKVTIGRDPGNDIVIHNPRASRRHCRIVHRLGNFVLLDTSTNGTYLTTAKHAERRVHKSMSPLTGFGQISFGQPWQADTQSGLTFEIRMAN